MLSIILEQAAQESRRMEEELECCKNRINVLEDQYDKDRQFLKQLAAQLQNYLEYN